VVNLEERQRQVVSSARLPAAARLFFSPKNSDRFTQIKLYLRSTLVMQGMHVEDIQKDKMRLLGWTLALMVMGLACLFIVVMVELS